MVGLEVKTVDVGTARASALRQPDAALGTVVENRLLTSKNAPAKRHIGRVIPVLVHEKLFIPILQNSHFRRA